MKIKNPLVRAGRKIIGVALCLVMIFTTFFIFDPSVLKLSAKAAVWGGGTSATSGTDYTVSGTTLHIKTPNGLAWFINSLGTYYNYTVYLDADFDLNNNDAFPVNSTTFTGTFDGQKHTISNFKSSCGRLDDYYGFFTRISGATIRNVIFDKAYVGNEDGAYNTNERHGNYGVVAGIAWGSSTVKDVKITNSYVGGRSYIGSVIGTVSGTTTTIQNCVSSCRVRGVRSFDGNNGNTLSLGIGGIVGFHNGGTLTITNCSYSNGAYSSSLSGGVEAYRHAGGMVGYASSSELTIKSCVNAGRVYASNDNAGGMAGYTGSGVTLKIEDCTNNGPINCPTGEVAGIVGLCESSNTIEITSCTNSEYGTISTGDPFAAGIVGRHGCDNLIKLTDCTNSAHISTDKSEVAGIIGKTQGFIEAVNCKNYGNISGTTDISGICGYIDDDTGIFNGCENHGTITASGNDAGGILAYVKEVASNGNTFQFINCKNTKAVQANAFAGGILGRINRDNEKEGVTSFVGCENSGNIKTTGGESCGGIAGRLSTNYGHTFTNCTNSGTVSSAGVYGGGIVGYCQGFLYATGCVNSGTVSGAGYTGGICGEIQDDRSTFTNCRNSGKVTGTNECIGGILGKTGGSLYLTGCSNSGEITGVGSWYGGIVGCLYNDAGIVETVGSQAMVFENLSNSGYVHTTGDRIGGIIGGNKGHGKWVNCSNTGAITSTGTGDGTYVGGIVGWIEDDMNNFEGCFNTAYVSGRYAAGGIVGYIGSCSSTFTMTNCYNLGNICGYSNYGHVGGLVGMFYGGTLNMTQCFNGDGQNGQIGLKNSMVHVGGGLIGYTTKTINITACYSHAPAIYVKSNANDDYAGGLIGRGTGTTTIKNSYAATNIMSGLYRGSIVGDGSPTVSYTHYSTVYNSYTKTNGTSQTDATFKGNTIISSTTNPYLNYYNKSYYMQDTTGVNGYYPIFGWYKDNGNVKCDVLYDNQFDFDSYNFQGSVVENNGSTTTYSPIYRDCEENSITFTSHSPDTYTNGQDSGTIAASPAQLNCMTLIPGHTYRVSYTFTTDKAANVNFYLFANTSNTAFNWNENLTNISSTISSAGTKSVSGTYTIPSGRPYVTIRCGTTTNGVTVKFKDIHIQDITNIAGQTDNVSTPDPKLNTVAYNGSVSSFPSITRSGYTFRGWSTTKDSTTGNGNPSNIVTSLSSITKNQQLYSCWSPAVYFDPNDGTSKVNLLTQPTTRKANDLYSPTLTSSPGNGVTATFDQTDSTITFNGTPTRDAEYFRFPIAGKLKANTNYTYRVVYVSGSKTLDGGTLTLTMDICDKNESTCFKASGTTYSDRFVFDQFANQETTWRTLAPDAYQAANAEFVKIFTYSTSYGTVKYNNYKVKVELVESDSVNQTYSPNAIQQYYNSQLGTLPTPTRTGYTFDGWYTAAEGGTMVESTTAMGSSDMTLYAHWTPNKYTITYKDGYSGATTATQTYTIEDNVTLNGALTRAGYTFAGWKLDTAVNTWSAGTYSASQNVGTGKYGNITLLAQWNAKDITLHYNGNNNTGGTIPADSTFKYASSVTTAAAPSRGYTVSYNANDGSVSTTSANTAANYTFSGWLSNKNSKSYSAATAYSDSFGATEGTVTLTAQWTGGTVTLPTPTKSGYTFAGWYTNSALTSSAGAAGATYTATSNITLYAKWTAKTYTVTFDKQGGTGGTDSVTATYDSAMPTITVPTRSGYTFGGYFTGTNGSGTQYYNANGTSARTWNIAANTTLYAKWTAKTDTVYKVNVYVMDTSGAYPTTPTTHSYTGTTDTSVTINEATWATYYPDKSGQFSLDNSKSNTLTGTINGNGTLVLVVYIKRASHTVYYNAQTNGGQTTTQQRTVYYQGAVDFSLTASKTGWTFVGWNTTSTATTKQTSLTMGTTDITLYAIFSCTPKAKFYYLDGTTQKYVEVSATIYNTATSADFAVPNVSASCNLNGLDWQPNGFTSNTSYAAGTTSDSMTYTSSSITASSDIKYYMNYSATVKLTHNGNNGTLTGSDPTGTSYLNASSVGTQTAVSLKAQTPAVRDGYVFLGWSESASATSASYAAEETISLKANKTLYAIWFDLKEAESKSDTYDSGYKDKQVTTPIVKGVKVKADGEFETLTDGVVTTFNAVQYEAYKNAVEAYNKAKDAFVANKTTANNATLLEKANALIKTALPTMNDLVDKYFKDADEVKSGNFVIEYDSSVTEKPIAAGQHSLKEMNLNHYKTEVLNNALSAKNSGAECKTVLQQEDLNTAVKNMAEAFVSVSNVTTTPAYKVYENADAAMDATDADEKKIISDTITAMNYVYAGKGNYTYYCYTNSTNPTLLITVDDIAGSTGRVCYPTKAETVSLSATGSGNAVAPTYRKISVDNTTYNEILTAEIGYGSTEIPDKNYYKKQTAIELQPTFTENENGTVVYKLKAYDDAYGANYATMSQLTNGNATDNALSTIPQTAETAENTITIIVNYHSGNQMNVTGDQVGADKVLKQYHLYRTSGGATNWELPKTGDKVYTVNDATYGQTDRGSFTFTYEKEATDIGSGKINTTDVNEIVKLFKTEANYNAAKSMTFVGAKYWVKEENGTYTEHEGSGLGYQVWGNNWSFNYYPKTKSYTYVHLVDRWGNTVDKVFYVGEQDYYEVKTTTTTSSAGAYEILEAGGSGIDTLSLNAASMEILTDENSTLENNVYKTTGNTVKIKTGEANKSYTLTMKDKATNSSTATLTSDENGIITLNVSDEAYTSGVYTFMLNDIEINLYDTVNNDKYIVKVNNGEAEEGDYAELSVVTTGEVGKIRFTDTDGNTITIASCEKNTDGTKTWRMSKKRAAGEYKYGISVKVGYNWIEESSKGTLTFTAKILDSGVIRSAEYDAETGLYKITIEGRATKIQFITEDGMTRTYTRYNEFVKSKKTYDAEGNEVNDTARTLDHEIWLVDAKLYSGLKYTVAGKFEAGWNMNGTATMTAH